MMDKELRKLGREELLEIMVAQSKEIEELKEKLKKTEEQLQNRAIKIQEVGSIAEASLVLNEVFQKAQAAADQYLENIRQLKEKQESMSAGIEEEARKKADNLMKEADKYCELQKKEANDYWNLIFRKMYQVNKDSPVEKQCIED